MSTPSTAASASTTSPEHTRPTSRPRAVTTSSTCGTGSTSPRARSSAWSTPRTRRRPTPCTARRTDWSPRRSTASRKGSEMRREALRGAVATAAVALVAGFAWAGTAQAHDDHTLDKVRKATAPFHSQAQARAAGYVDPGLPCFDSPSTNQGMGFHLVKPGLIGDGGKLDPLHPEALVYEEHQGGLKLVAVEYLVSMDDAAEAPTFLGQRMIPNEPLHLWT